MSMHSNPPEDKHAAERAAMVDEQLAGRGIRDQGVLNAMRRIPRELFVPAALQGRAYADGALPIDCAQTISQPYMVGRMTELLELQPEQVVLEVGTGSGYQAAILACLAKQVYTIEWHMRLMLDAQRRLAALGLRNVALRCGDGSIGWPEKAPYDAIIVTAGAPEIPPALQSQLRVGGRLVIPVGPAGDETLTQVRRTESGFETVAALRCRFVKLRGVQGWRD